MNQQFNTTEKGRHVSVRSQICSLIQSKLEDIVVNEGQLLEWSNKDRLC